MLDRKSIKSAFESMLFIWGQPLPAKDAADTLDISKKDAIEIFNELMEEYEREERGIRVRRVNESYQFITNPENADAVKRLCTPVKIKRLSQAALEVLAIIAYRQPVTKGEIDAIRGVKCDRVIEGLEKKGLIREKGRSDAVGRPVLYATTDMFLKNFGFEDLSELPEIEDLESVMEVDEDYEEEPDSGQLSIDMSGSESREESDE
ncbi:MAG: SMC-Scp complex subunit ScpB [Eubacterium sp.]|nr:SMC-Scp complex subunit ScpB [Eubacterium sp.]